MGGDFIASGDLGLGRLRREGQNTWLIQKDTTYTQREGGTDNLVRGSGQDFPERSPVLVLKEGGEEAREGRVKQTTQEEVNRLGRKLERKLQHRLSKWTPQLQCVEYTVSMKYSNLIGQIT